MNAIFTSNRQPTVAPLQPVPVVLSDAGKQIVNSLPGETEPSRLGMFTIKDDWLGY